MATERAGCSYCLVHDGQPPQEHVLAELRAYERLVKPGSYLVVFDTLIDDMDDEASANRPWGKGNNPKTAVREFLRSSAESARRL